MLKKLFKQSSLQELIDEKLVFFLPLGIMAKGTVLLFGVDAHILENSPSQIKNELQRLNEFTNNNIGSVTKFPKNAPIIKITFLEPASAQNCPPKIGLKMFN